MHEFDEIENQRRRQVKEMINNDIRRRESKNTQLQDNLYVEDNVYKSLYTKQTTSNQNPESTKKTEMFSSVKKNITEQEDRYKTARDKQQAKVNNSFGNVYRLQDGRQTDNNNTLFVITQSDNNMITDGNMRSIGSGTDSNMVVNNNKMGNSTASRLHNERIQRIGNLQDNRMNSFVSNEPITHTNQLYSYQSSTTNTLQNNNPDLLTRYFDFNLEISDFYKQNFACFSEFSKLVNTIKEEKATMAKGDIIQIKLEVTKRLNQLSSDFDHIILLSRFLKPYINSNIFIETFTAKIIEQSTIQVARHKESYKQFSFFFKLLFSKNLFFYYKFTVLTKECNDKSIKGIYLVFFGILKECDMINEVWYFIAGILNVEITNFLVLEIFIDVLGDYLIKKLGPFSMKIFRYIKTFVIDKITNPSQKYKIDKFISSVVK